VLDILFGRKTGNLLGIDITSSAIKVLELSRNKGKTKVESYAVEPIAAQSVQDKNIVDMDHVAEALKKAIVKAKTKAKYGVCAVSGASVVVKNIEMPSHFSEESILNEIVSQSEEYIPYPIDEMSLDFEIIGPSLETSSMNDVLLTACQKELVEQRIQLLERVGLKAHIVDIEAYAMERCFDFLLDQVSIDRKELVGILDVGATITTLSVYKQGRMLYTRDQSFGGKQLTEEIQRRYGLTYQEAGAAKRQGGLPDDYIPEVLMPFKELIVQQASRSLQFFFSSSQYNHIDHLILAGGNAVIPQLDDLIQGKLGVSVSIANPFFDMTLSSSVDAEYLKNDAPAMVTACGLALRSFD
jgi:type IV pilus assembly protein PilM